MTKAGAGTLVGSAGKSAKRSASRAVVYCRVSSHEQLKGLSLETQSKACIDYCRSQGMEVAEVFVERAESASTTDRTQLQRMLTYCRTHRGRIHFLVVYMLDRFARNQYDHHALKAYLQKLGITLRAVAQPIDDSATGKLMDGILAAFNEFDNNVRRERCVGGMQAAASRGRWVFPPPLGYRVALKADGAKTIEPDPQAAPLVRHAFAMAASGLHSVAEILREVRRRGLTGRRGAELSSGMLHKLLRKTVYHGRVVVENWGIDVSGDFEPLVDEETFTKAQVAITGAKPLLTGYQRNHPDFPLRRFVRCAHCSKPLSGAWSKGKRARYAYYNCPGCRRINVPQQQFEARFVELLERLTPRPEVLKLLSAAVLERWNEEQKGVAEKRRAIEQRLDALHQRKERIVSAYLYEGAIDKETYQAHLARVEEELTLAKIDRHEAEIDEFDIEGTLAFAEHLVTHSSRLWIEAALDQRQRLQKLFFPEGLSFDGEEFRTPLTCPFFMNIEGTSHQVSEMVEQKGFEPSTPTLRTWCSPS